MIALHKDRRMLTVQLQVARLSGIGEDTMFLGVMQVGRGAAGGVISQLWFQDVLATWQICS